MTTLTLVTVAVIVYGVMGRRGYGRALALGGATPVGAAAVAGAIAVPTFYAVAVGAAVGVMLRFLRRAQEPERELPPIPGVQPLVLLVPVALMVTLLAPLFFNGLPVLLPSGADAQLSAGLLTKSNIAQIGYLALSVCVVVYLARSRYTGPEVVGIAVCLCTVFSFWAYLGTLGAPFPRGFFDNSPAFTFQETLPGGQPRVRGIMSEPSGLAASSLMTMAYTASRVRSVRGWHRTGLVFCFAMALYLGLIATSATFFVAGVVVAGLAVAIAAVQFVLRRGPLSQVTATVLCLAAIASLWVLPALSNFLGLIVSDKVDSSSYEERSGADSYSYELVWNTYGFGVGLGANRASSFAASLLSTVGVVGALLLVATLWIVIREAWPNKRYRPVVWTLLALLVAKVIAGPDLADTSGVMWMSLGVLAHAALQRSQRARTLPRVARDASLRRPAEPARVEAPVRLSPRPQAGL
ncbi:hypothetical protein SAMN06264364_10447 [Quadrisphaera granulorum]|uniref:O-antigen ligase-like membrane protein n=1 Tax=Quadrisphaera granulorum TaxID=317664 RepID=A0A316ABH0_9ACTN|nr:hypothetical protein [Quadrisphaera granulorum]PWJ55126.1 hypothetical protein BXY45_10447 [Quadrisphaera granulorum]SZE95635.1 hypothetical protein SAMN06264364_10447 [Quadrisphaera granulorum]